METKKPIQLVPQKRKLRKIESNTVKWGKMANELARTWVEIHPCNDCGRPVIKGYCCSYCGSENP
jgi:hypothetical protein